MDDSSDEAEHCNMSRAQAVGQATDGPTPARGEDVSIGRGNSGASGTPKPEQIAEVLAPTSDGGMGSCHGNRDDVPDNQDTNV